MTRYSRLFIALLVLLSGVAFIPQVGIFAGVVSWQRYANGYEDQVTVIVANYEEGQLTVTARNALGARATLSVYRTADNSYIGDLLYDNVNDYHSGVFDVGSNPEVITVRSSLGGEATVLVTDNNDPPPTVTPNPGEIGFETYFPLILRQDNP